MVKTNYQKLLSFFHITDVEEQFDKLLIEGDIKAISIFFLIYI